MKTMETTEEVSSRGVEKCAERHKWQRNVPLPAKNRGRTGKKDLQNCGGGRISRKITKKVHAGREPETKWEIPD
jgi:hypothetical protein